MKRQRRLPIAAIKYAPPVFLADATDFTDMTPREPTQTQTVRCPKCQGYGGWNLQLDAYGKPGNAPNQRHFRAFCNQCWGWGWVAPGLDVECLHEMQSIAPDQPFRCWHTDKCVKCGRIQSYSSDD